MLASGLCSLAGGLCGSPVGLSVFFGHPAYKDMGARSGYAVLNGFAFLLASSTGLAAPFLALFVLPPMSPIIVFVGLVIAADSFGTLPKRHYPAVLLGMVPFIATWGPPL